MKIRTTRVETFSDGVIAIILTIMVLTLKLPSFSQQETTESVRSHLQELIPYFVTYAFSFLMIGIFWINHHHMFHLLENTDEPLLLQNLFFLFWMSLIPLATSMVGANPKISDSAAMYGAIMLMTSLAFSIMRNHSIKKNLVHRDTDKKVNTSIRFVSVRARTKSYIGTLVYLSSIPLAYVSVYISYIIFMIPPILFFIPDGIDDEELAEKIQHKNTPELKK